MIVLCQEFNGTSEYIFKWYTIQTKVKEESLTDWLLYNLSLKLPIFKYQPFTRYQENKITGADFEFWILGREKNFAMRIQAKKLNKDIRYNHYGAVAYPEKTKKQINLLISSSISSSSGGLTFRPFYLFYNNGFNKSQCQRINSGMLITDAKEIVSKYLTGKRIKILRKNILNISIPFECLFCCPLSDYNSSTLDGIRNILSSYFPSDNETNNLGFNQDIPNYIQDLVNPEITEDFWIENYQNELIDTVDCVAVLDLRKY